MKQKPTTVKLICSISAVILPVTPVTAIYAVPIATLPLRLSAFCRGRSCGYCMEMACMQTNLVLTTSGRLFVLFAKKGCRHSKRVTWNCDQKSSHGTAEQAKLMLSTYIFRILHKSHKKVGRQTEVLSLTTVKFICPIITVVFSVAPQTGVNAVATSTFPLTFLTTSRCWCLICELPGYFLPYGFVCPFYGTAEARLSELNGSQGKHSGKRKLASKQNLATFGCQ